MTEKYVEITLILYLLLQDSGGEEDGENNGEYMNPVEGLDNQISGGIKPWDGRGGQIYEMPGQYRNMVS